MPILHDFRMARTTTTECSSHEVPTKGPRTREANRLLLPQANGIGTRIRLQRTTFHIRIVVSDPRPLDYCPRKINHTHSQRSSPATQEQRGRFTARPL